MSSAMRARRTALLAGCLVAIAPAAFAGQLRYLESPAKQALGVAALVVDLQGWPVVADGGEVGKALGVIVSADGDIEGVRARVSVPMGIGTRVVDLPAEILSLTRDAVVLHVSVAELIESATPELREMYPE
jgi:hypothetical protein